MTTTTTTSVTADLPDAMHMAELLENPINVVCQKTAAAVLRHQHSELERLHALAAGQATAAPAQPAPAGESDGFMEAVNELDALHEVQPAPATQQAGVALSDDLRDRLVAISEAIADQDDRAAQAMLREILKAPPADSVLYDPRAVLDVFNGARAGSEKPVGYMRGIRAVIAHWESRPEPHRWLVPARADSVQEDAARHFFDAGWKACANFCDRDDVRFDGIVGHRGCPQFEEAFRAARKQGGAT